MEMATRPELDSAVQDHLDVDVPLGGRALVVSDLHLAAPSTAGSRLAVRELGQALEGWAGPGVLVLLGDVLELLRGENDGDPAVTLAVHSRFTAALARFAAEPGRRILYVLGNHDGRLAWDTAAARTVAAATGAALCLSADLRFDTGAGPRTVRVEHGHRLDPSNAFADPRNPLDIPLGQHVVREALPALEGAAWLSGVEHLADPGAVPSFIASRLAYRKMARYLAWLVVPLLLALAVKIPLVVALAQHRGRAGELSTWSHRLLMLGGIVTVDVALVGVTVALGARQVWRALSGSLGALSSRDGNRAAEREAETLIGQGGYAGFITGHTHRAELRPVGSGFYANSGCCDETVVERAARFGLPPVFAAEQERSWIELEAGAELRVRLHHTRTPQPSERLLERLATRRRPGAPLRPVVVAEYPQGESWPRDDTDLLRLRSIRRRAAAALAAAGVLNLVSAVTPPLRSRLSWLLAAVPLAVPQVAAVAVALAGLGLLLLGRGVRRGQRRAWLVSLALVLGSAVLHLAKGVDVEEVVVAGGVAGYLMKHRRAFRVASDAASARVGLLWAAIGGALATIVGTAAAWMLKSPAGRLPLHRAALAAVERLVGLSAVPVAHRLDDFLSPVLAAVGFGLVAVLGWQLLQPVIHRVVDHGRADRARATQAVRRYGADSLAYFALRDDKQYFFHGESVVAYAVLGGVALMSPDPIGPVGERAAAWTAFRRFADDQGWIVAGIGVTEDWLPIYRASGLRTLYVGDEAVVDCSTFTLDGSRMKSVRQAYNRVARGGYTVEFHDPARIDAALADRLRALSQESRRGEAERGFSMTLGRIFAPEDTDLLLAVCLDATGEPAAFCQFVPAPGIAGYSLDLMRRSVGQHPNGLLDYILLETIFHVRANGHRGLALNFATLRAVLAGETGDGASQRIERWLLQKMSGTMQIESLWHFNAKYDPDWRPRYAVYEAPGQLLPAAWAVAKAESFVEIPLIGRMLAPKPVKAA
jgi:lysylphosphatidylglycerol synthetase-like protein (DUF2156 family)/UDP-2,3-diacylglucosamine pyrophosphatase LpxH